MSKKEMIQGKGSGTLKGIIVGKESPRKGNEYVEGVDKKQNKYRKMRLMVKTSKNNLVVLDFFGGVRDYVYAYNSKEKITKKIAWDKRNDELPSGFTFINPPEYDLVGEIHKNYKDGDSVKIKFTPTFSTYETNDGKIKQQVKFLGKNIERIEPINFDSENFEEEVNFTQDIVIREITEDTAEKKLYISAYVILYGNKFEPAEFVLDTERDADFTKNMKGLKFGDSIKIYGTIQNRVITEEKQEKTGWGDQPQSAYDIIRYLEIRGALGETLQKKLYKEDDFEKIEDGITAEQKKALVKEVKDEEGLPFKLDE